MTETSPYQAGNPVTVTPDPYLVGTTPTDPPVITFRVRRPDNTLEVFVYGPDPEVTKITTGLYELAYGVPSEPGEYHWDVVYSDGSSVLQTIPGDFYVIASSVVPPPEVPGPVMPPAQTWINGSDLVGFCPVAATLDPQIVDAYAVTSSMLAFECSGRQFYGTTGPVTVRPCRSQCNAGLLGWGSWQWSWGYWSGDWGYGWSWGNDNGGRLCSCGYDSKVDLAGYPVRQVTQVKIDGQVLPTTFDDGSPTYRLDQWRYLTRLSDPANPDFPLHWPACQRLDLQDNQPGTWSVTYIYGTDPPPAGILAAKQLACQMLQAEAGLACQLPPNATKIVKQGVTVDRITPLADLLRSGKTGMMLWDSFIAGYNPNGLRRQPSVFSPDTPYPVRVGNE